MIKVFLITRDWVRKNECKFVNIKNPICVCLYLVVRKLKKDTWSWNFASLPTLFVLHLLFKRFSFFDNSTQLLFVAQDMQNVVNRKSTSQKKKKSKVNTHINCSEMATKDIATNELQKM